MGKWNDSSRLILLAIGALLLTGCGLGAPQIEGAERDAVLAYAELATDNVVVGLQADDYAQFSRDMSPDLVTAMPEDQFEALRTMLDTKVGAYVSRQVSGVEESDGFIAVVYDAQHENEEHVTMRVVFDQDQKISGLWFDSPKLRQ